MTGDGTPGDGGQPTGFDPRVGDWIEPPEQKCGSCRFWDDENSYPHGTPAHPGPVTAHCRRFPPVLVGDFVSFPRTKDSDWCGEWRQR